MTTHRATGPALLRLTFALALCASISVLAVLTLRAPANDAAAWDSETAAFVSYINQFRAANGVAPLAVNTNANNAAQWMAEHNAARGSLSTKDSFGRGPGDRLTYFGVSWSSVVEFPAYGYETGLALYTSYMDPSFGAPYLGLFCDPKYNAIGVGRTPSSQYGWLWTIDLIRLSGSGPYPPAPSCEPVPASTPPPATPTPTLSPTPSPTPSPATSPTPAPSPSPEPTPLPGDVDCDGALTTLDVLQVLHLAAGAPAPACTADADLDCNGATDAADALAILRTLAGLPTPAPAACT